MNRKKNQVCKAQKGTHFVSIDCAAFLYLLVYVIAILRWFGIRDCDSIISTCDNNLMNVFEIRLVNHIHVAHSRKGRKTIIEK